MTIGFAERVANALEVCSSVEVAEAKDLLSNSKTLFVDVRDLHELQNGGKITGAVHASRGMLEFLIDPESPYYNETFQPESDTHYVVYCMSGGRSALAAATMKEMGYSNVATLSGGFKAWCAAQGVVENQD